MEPDCCVIKWGEKYLSFNKDLYYGKYSWVKDRTSAYLYLGSKSIVLDFLSGQRNQDTKISTFLKGKVINVISVTMLEHVE